MLRKVVSTAVEGRNLQEIRSDPNLSRHIRGSRTDAQGHRHVTYVLSGSRHPCIKRQSQYAGVVACFLHGKFWLLHFLSVMRRRWARSLIVVRLISNSRCLCHMCCCTMRCNKARESVSLFLQSSKRARSMPQTNKWQMKWRIPKRLVD